VQAYAIRERARTIVLYCSRPTVVGQSVSYPTQNDVNPEAAAAARSTTVTDDSPASCIHHPTLRRSVRKKLYIISYVTYIICIDIFCSVLICILYTCVALPA